MAKLSPLFYTKKLFSNPQKGTFQNVFNFTHLNCDYYSLTIYFKGQPSNINIYAGGGVVEGGANRCSLLKNPVPGPKENNAIAFSHS